VEAGVFGLLGVIIGGVLSGVVNLMLERRREVREIRNAARATLMHLPDVKEYARKALASERWLPVDPQVVWAYNIWLYWRDKLASTLEGRDWRTIEPPLNSLRTDKQTASGNEVRINSCGLGNPSSLRCDFWARW